MRKIHRQSRLENWLLSSLIHTMKTLVIAYTFPEKITDAQISIAAKMLREKKPFGAIGAMSYRADEEAAK